MKNRFIFSVEDFHSGVFDGGDKCGCLAVRGTLVFGFDGFEGLFVAFVCGFVDFEGRAFGEKGFEI